MDNSEENMDFDVVDDSSEDEDYGGCVGPDSMYVRLISSDGHQFIIQRKYVLISPTLDAMLGRPGVYTESQDNAVVFKNIPSNILRIVCQYLTYIAQQKENTAEIPPFPITKDIAFEVLMAANFLDL